MSPRHRRIAAAVITSTATAALAATTAVPAAAAPRPVQVVTSGLEGPFGIQTVGNTLTGFVAESGSGEVTQVFVDGTQRVVFDGAPGVAAVGAGEYRVFAVMGGGDETGEAPPSKYPPSTVLSSNYGGTKVREIADLAQWELDHNPDGQVQFNEAQEPYETLTNPFAMNLSGLGLLVADAGANAVLKVNPRTGDISTFFVPPTVTDVPACLEEGVQANPGAVGCDSVPTGVDVVNGQVYVSTLGSEVPGAGRVYRLGRHGKVLQVWKNLTAPTGVAAAPDGSVYVSEVFEGAPAGPPPPGFDPRDIGQITRIAPDGARTHAQVTMPTGLEYSRGRLLASAWSVAGFLGMKNAGQVVWVRPSAFH